MGATCQVCRHPERYKIESFLVSRSRTQKDIGQEFGFDKSALSRHVQQGHIAESLAYAEGAERRAAGGSLLDRVEALHEETLAILSEVRDGDDKRVALAAIREARSNLELIGQVTKELDNRPIIALNLSPEWLSIRAVIVASLDGFPEARESLLTALEDGNGAS